MLPLPSDPDRGAPSHAAMLRLLLPPKAVVTTTESDVATTPLFSLEAAVVKGSAPARQQEFAAGRACARRLLVQLGRPGAAVLAGAAREPLWPAGIVGSITHTRGSGGGRSVSAAAIAESGVLQGLGIDIERNVVLGPGPRRLVLRDAEIPAATGPAGVDAAVLVFSAKESFYKAWYPCTGRRLDFLDVAVRVDVARRTFGVRLVGPAGGLPDGMAVRGRWAATATHVFTVATITRAPGRS